jgi:hypothetical protein
MTIRFMLDSDNLSDLTGHAEILATYADLVTNLPALRMQYPDSVVVLIDRGLGDHTGLGTIADVERGAMTPEQVPVWYDKQHAKGLHNLTVYCSRDTIAAVDAAMGKRVFYQWIATLDGTAHIDGHKPLESPAAVQCFSSTMLGVHADGSLVLQDHWNSTYDTANAVQFRADIANAHKHLAEANAFLRKLATAFGG